jgi:Carboxypeptidase regulatory-like domain/TonB dependent receptor/TonB-dependent Receptor Plug Domain
MYTTMDSNFVRKVSLSGIFLVLMFAAIFAGAQGIVTGSISGSVEDASGALVPGAKISARELSTNRVYTTSSTSAGIISLRNVPPGTYDVRVEAPSFRVYESKGLVVAVGGDTSMGAVKLEIGSSAETVTVEGAAPLIEATTDQISGTFNSQQTVSLPVGNTFDSLALFLPGVSTAGDVSFSNNNGAEISVNGQRARSNNYQLDGQSNNDNSIGGPSIFFGNQDAISEVQVVTNFSAEYGRNMGAVVNYVTKSGTNAFHGTGFEFWQGNTFSSLENEEKSPVFGFCTPGQDPTATGCTEPVMPKFVDNRFGGSIGGPIIKDRLWFFGSTNFERQRFAGSPSSTGGGIVPTANGVQELIADFPNSPAGPLYASIGPTAVTAGNPTFTNVQNVLATDQVDPTTGEAFVCATAGVNGCQPIEMGTISRTVSSPFNDYEATGRIDVRLTSKDNLFGRYIYQRGDSEGVNFGNGISVGDWQTVPGRSQQIGFDWTHTFSNVFLNQVRLSYSRASSFFDEGSFPTCNSTNPFACPTDVIMAGSAPQDRTSFGVAAGFPQGRIINVYQLQDNASVSKGVHTIKFGAEVAQQRSPNVFLPENNALPVFLAFSDLVANDPFETQIALGNPNLPFKENDLSFYFQDDWRIKSNLTLNLGLRWEWFQQAANLLHDRSVANQKGPDPLWDPTLPLALTTVPSVNQDLNNFSPVIGFAWTPGFAKKVLGENQTVVRGGFRIAYDPTFYNMFLNEATAAPAINLATLPGPVIGGTTVLPTTGTYFGTQLVPFYTPQVPQGNPGFATQLLLPKNFHNPYSEQWNLGIQREFTSKIVGEIRYVGNHTVGNFQEANGNPDLAPLVAAGFQNLIPAGMTPCADATAPGFGFANCNKSLLVQYGNTAWSKYNGLQTELRIGGWHGLSATASYTYSRTFDNTSEIFSTIAGGNTVSYPQSPFNTDRGERGPSGIDFPHVVGITMVYEVPFFHAQKGIAGRVLGGWQINTTYRYSTGQPYTTIESHDPGSLCDPSTTFSQSHDACRPILANTSAPLGTVGQCTDATAADCGLVDFVTGNPTTRSAVHWIYNDPVAAAFFGTPFAGAGRNILRGQPISTANLGVFKNFKITEKFTAQFQAQAFNVMNVQFRGVPDPLLNDAGSSFQNTNFNSNGGSTFAGSTVADGIARRRLLFGMKLIF